MVFGVRASVSEAAIFFILFISSLSRSMLFLYFGNCRQSIIGCRVRQGTLFAARFLSVMCPLGSIHYCSSHTLGR